jgi:2-iminobutanoate/2-iminopropanoate deaminase
MSNVTQINPDRLGPAIAPYSQATVAGNTVFIAGQVALDDDNHVIAPGDALTQTRVALNRIEVILDEVGASLSDIASATVFITSTEHFASVNQAWTERFGDHRPARATVIVGLLIEGLVVEIQATAVRRES